MHKVLHYLCPGTKNFQKVKETKFIFPKLMWVMDWVLQLFYFGWVAKGHGDFFLLQSADARRFKWFFRRSVEESNAMQAPKLAESLIENFTHRNKKWIVLFPEGGLLWKRRASSQRFAEKNGLPVLQHVALPRVGAAKCILQTLGVSVAQDGFLDKPSIRSSHFVNEGALAAKSIEFILDVTIGYRQPMSVVQFLFGVHGQQNTFVHYRIFNLSDVFKDQQELDTDVLTKWLYNLFEEKELMLKHFHEHGEFPDGKNAKLCSPIKYKQIFYIHVFVALSLILFYNVGLWLFF